MPIKYFQHFFSAVAVVLMFSSCHNYYKITSLTSHDTPDLATKFDSIKSTNRYFILRNGAREAYQMTNIQVSADQNTALMTLDSVSDTHRYHFSNTASHRRYSKMKPGQKQVVNEVHTYIPYDTAAKTGSYTLPFANVQKIEVLQHDSKRTTNSFVLGGLLIVAVALAGVGIYVLELLSNEN